MTELVPRDGASVGAFDPNNEKILTYLGLNPRDPKSAAVVAVARRYDLDPVLKHVIVIPQGGVYITRDGLLHVAHASRQLDGIVVEQEPTLSDDGREWTARVSVWRKDMSHPFTFPGRYPVNGNNKAYAQEMALKAAESHALRRAFSVAGLPSLDERRAEQARASVHAGSAPTAAEYLPSTRTDRDPALPATPDPSITVLFDQLGVTDPTDASALMSLYLGRPVQPGESIAGAEYETVLAALATIAGQDDEGRAADLARDLTEARQLAAERDPQ